MKILKEEKAQVAVEYLIIIVAAVIIATVVALFAKSTVNQGGEAIDSATQYG